MKICKHSKKTVVILGSTCTGKTSLAVKLCPHFNGSIISADSRQVVRHMDIGTGKVPASQNDKTVNILDDRWKLDGVDVFGYDLVDPDAYFSAYDFVKYGQEIFPRVSHEGKNVFLVGGTGFYIDSVTGRADIKGAEPDLGFRKTLEGLSVEELANKLLEVDEPTYMKIDLKNPARLVRAIEKATHLEKSDKVIPAVGDPLYIGLAAEREVLYQLADRWVDGIFGEKLFEEVKKIQNQYPKSHRLNGLIYKSVVDYLDGILELEEAKQRAKFDTHAYIRRQQTWFKRNPEIKWFDISKKNFDADITSLVELELNGQR